MKFFVYDTGTQRKLVNGIHWLALCACIVAQAWGLAHAIGHAA